MSEGATVTVANPIAAVTDALRAEFPADQVGQLPKGGVMLDYVGHAAVRLRLLDVDPEWNWEPVATDERGIPQFDVDANGNPIGFWIRLTIYGVSRLGYGSCPSKQFDAEKVLIGDALRNAAMSFGVATYLWVKGHDEDPQDGPRERAAPQPEPALPPLGWATREEAAEAHKAVTARLHDLDDEQRTALKAWRDANGVTGWPLPRDQFDAFVDYVNQFVPQGPPLTPVGLVGDGDSETAAGVAEHADPDPSPAVLPDPEMERLLAEEMLIDLQHKAEQLVKTFALTPPHQDAWREHVRGTGLSSNPRRWTEAQCNAAIEWVGAREAESYTETLV